MRKGRPSLTAHIVAAVRAGLTARGVLSDPYAKLFVRPPIRMLSRIVRTPARSFPLLREMVANVAGRTLLFDRQTALALDEGIQQVVILGAGYDSRPYRFAREGTRFIEVDNADTQAVKQSRLKSAGVDVGTVELLAMDFETDSLAERLRTLLTPEKPSLFLWEGVVEYLPEESVRSVLSDLATLATPQSRLVFDIPHSSATCKPLVDFMSRALSRMLGEPKGLAMEPDSLEVLLGEVGWCMKDKVEITQLYERHFKDAISRAPTPHNYYVVATPSVC